MESTLDDIIELRASDGHAHVQARIGEQIRRVSQKLEQRVDEAETNYLRGQIAGLRTALVIPEIIETEARQQPKAA